MLNWQDLVNNKVRLLNHQHHFPFSHYSHPAISSFAIDDAVATAVGDAHSPMTVRFWVHDKTVVLGIPDSRLPYVDEGIEFIKRQHFHPIVRNSGGLAVALDKGVLNISFIFPNSKKTSIHASYEMMFRFIKDILARYTTKIKAYEIVGSFCPGDYDLSIGGIKFAGISQRRVRNGISVQIYIDICGNSLLRAELIKQFYKVSKKNEQTSYDYPKINPDVMGSLSELLNIKITVDEIVEQIKMFINEASINVLESDLTNYEREIYEKRLKQMISRNEFIHRFRTNL